MRPLVLLLCLLAAPAVARADEHLETERRLKLAGIDDALRERIHQAIRRGVARLIERQDAHGRMGVHRSRDHGPGMTALAGLALRHAAIPDGVKGARHAIRWLLVKRAKTCLSRTYPAGILAMLLAADESQQPFLIRLHEKLSKGPRNSGGYWSYGTSSVRGTANLSTAQFGALGLWAAERRGVPAATKVWATHLDALLRGQEIDGSWAYVQPWRNTDWPVPDPAIPWRGGYPTGTFMGLANLVLARHALADELADDPDLDARVRIASGRARSALRRHALWVIGRPGAAARSIGSPWPCYRLYALEKACVFLEREEIGGLAWYRIGAERLLEAQHADGGWPASTSGSDLVGTSFALLFLLRDAESYRPVTPRPIGRPRGPVTPSPASEADAPERARRALPLSVANAGLARLASELARRRLDDPTRVHEALTFVRRTYDAYRPVDGTSPPEHDDWCRRAEDVLLDAVVLFDRAPKADRDQRLAIALEVLDFLASTSRRIGRRLMERVLDRANDKHFPPPYRLAWYGAALDALRAVRPPLFASWLTGRCLDADPDHLWRNVAALTALSGIAPTLDGRERRAAARGVVAALRAMERRSDGDFRWAHLMRDASICLARLAGVAGAEPPDDLPVPAGRVPADEYRRVAAWIRAHADPDDPAWR